MITNLDTFISDETLTRQKESTYMVLLIDDQAIVAEKVRRDLFEDSRIDFHFCADAQEATKLVESVSPTVILLDLVMPGVDGIDAIKLFRQHPVTHDVPIIILSNKEHGELKAMAFEAGADDYLVKMPEKIELVARVVYHSTNYLAKKQRDHAYLALRASQRKMEEKNFELMQQSTVDGLTGVGNRRALDSVIEQTWVNSLRSHTDVSLIMIDVDHFKLFNDCYGHIAGDDCLRKIAHALADELPRATDFVARYGGEEFAVVLSCTNLQGAKIVAERLRNKISQLKIENKKSPVSKFVSISEGVSSVVPERKMSRQSLFKSADTALYEAKESGRNQVVVNELMLESSSV